jgi:hypothetical protein
MLSTGLSNSVRRRWPGQARAGAAAAVARTMSTCIGLAHVQRGRLTPLMVAELISGIRTCLPPMFSAVRFEVFLKRNWKVRSSRVAVVVDVDFVQRVRVELVEVRAALRILEGNVVRDHGHIVLRPGA